LVISQVPSASSQANEDQEPTPVEAPPREWATLDVTIEAPDSLAAGMGQKAVVSITIANNGNISASGIIAIAEGGNILVGEPVKVDDLPPGKQVTLALPFTVDGRSAFPIPLAVRVSAENVAYPTYTTIEQNFTGLDEGEYLSSTIDGDVLLEQRYATYERGFERPQPLIWLELRQQAPGAPLTIDLSRLLTGVPPKDLLLNVLYYANEQESPKLLDASFDLSQFSITFTSAGAGHYLIEWSRPAPVSDSAEEPGTDELNMAAATVTEPELPQGWTPTYHSPLVSEFNGSVSLGYPILTPPGAAGLQPNLGLAYSSANGNGMVGRLQADDAGFGWNNTALIDVTQALVICHGSNVCEAYVDLDGNPNTNDPYNQYMLSFNGVGYELVHSNGKTSNGQAGRYYAEGHAGLYIELCKAPLLGLLRLFRHEH
jgi:hypothetical protein